MGVDEPDRVLRVPGGGNGDRYVSSEGGGAGGASRSSLLAASRVRFLSPFLSLSLSLSLVLPRCYLVQLWCCVPVCLTRGKGERRKWCRGRAAVGEERGGAGGGGELVELPSFRFFRAGVCVVDRVYRSGKTEGVEGRGPFATCKRSESVLQVIALRFILRFISTPPICRRPE